MLMLCTLWPTASFAAQGPDFYIAVSKSKVTVGNQIEVEIRASNVQAMVAYELNLSFDSALVTPVGSSFTTNLSGFSTIVNPELLSGGHLRAVYTKLGNAAGDNGDLVLGKVKFTSKAKGTAAFTLNQIKIGQTGDQWATYTPNVQVSVQIASSSGNGTVGGDSSPEPEPDKAPVEVKDGAITATGKANEDGTLVVSLSPEDIAEAIKSAKSDTITIEVKSESGTEAEGTTIVIPVKELAANTGNRELAVKWGRVKVRFPAKPNEGVIEADSQAVEVAIHSVNETEIADSAKQRIKGDIVFDIDLKVDGRDVQTFGPGHPVTVEIDNTPLQGERTHQLIVYRIMDNGELEIVKNAKYEQGVLKFQPDSSGRYAAAYVDVSFTDLNQTAWARTMIESLAAREVLQGVGQDRFAPSRTVTRAEFVELLLNALQLKENASAESGFADVDQDDWYFDAVTTASRLGIVSGKSDGSFGAKEEISREDMAVMLSRAFQYAGLAIDTSHSSGQTFSDEEKIASYAQEAVDRLFATGIIKGFEDGSFQPKASATRAQAAAVIYKLLNL
jgi:hypothetical protein